MVINPSTGKVMKRKVVPKKKLLDEHGGIEWEVVDKKKTIIVDESDDDGYKTSEESD